MDLICCNNKHKEYNSILYQLEELYRYKKEKTKIFNFSKSGKLIICLIEFRLMEEIKYVIYALLSVYSPNEIGLAFVYGKLNKKYIEETFKDFNNIQLIEYDYDNINRGIYSAILKTPEFYENFLNWSHLLIYQTDSVLLRKVDDIYFDYDYVGAPWIESNQWCKYNAGNGGFSLRNIKSCIRVCELNRGKNILMNIHRGNEDGFFCNQDSFNYVPINSDLHKAFSVERIYYPKPIGCHQIYHSANFSNKEWNEFLKYMKKNLIYLMNDCPDINYLINESKQDKYKIKEKELRFNYVKNVNYEKELTKVDEVLNVSKQIGPFELIFENSKRNKWKINCNKDYEIIFSLDTNESNVVKTHKVSTYTPSTVHKKDSGVYFKQSDDAVYIIFYPGFPNGGECWADIHANGHYNHCKDLPKNGAIILKSYVKEIINKKMINTVNYNIKTENNVLAIDLFTGVGFYNQLFSLEFAVYLAHITNRYLILNIRHPLVACGKPDINYGTILDYISDDFKQYLIGFEVREKCNFVDPKEFIIDLPNKISNCVFIDISNNFTAEEIKEFVNFRQIVSSNMMRKIFGDDKLIYISKSNASRVFYNFLTTKENYIKMNKIVHALSTLSNTLLSFSKSIILHDADKTLGIHLRLGDWHKSINEKSLRTILSNVKKWLEKNPEYKNILLMTDKESQLITEAFKNYKLLNTRDFISSKISDKLTKTYKNNNVAKFLLEQYLLLQSKTFIGSQGSTVSVYIQYINYLNNKEYELYTHSDCTSFNSETLKLNIVNTKGLFEWKKKNYMGGHPISWSMFFTDNVYKDVLPDKAVIPQVKEAIKEAIKEPIKEPIKEAIKEPIKLTIDEINNKSMVGKKNERSNYIQSYVYKSEPFMSIDIWIEHCDIFIDNRSIVGNIMDFVNSTGKVKIIIGIKTDILFDCIDILSNINKHFILLTLSNDDHCPPYLDTIKPTSNTTLLEIEKLLNSEYLIKWFAKNPGIIHFKMAPYMLGPKWQWRTTKFNGENKNKMIDVYNRYCMTPETKFYNKDLKQNLLYFNFTVQTTNNPLYSSHKNIRRDVKANLLKNFKWVENEEFEEYIKTLEKYKFCVCPPGRGIDTHRCWEALMVGTIPIVLSSSLNSLYINLPVLVLENLNIITEAYLNKEYSRLIKQRYKFEKLYSHYWKNELFKLML